MMPGLSLSRVAVALSAVVLSAAAAAAVAAGCDSSDSAGGAAGGPSGGRYCDNDQDRAARVRGYCPGNRNIQEVTGDCALDCLFQEDAGGCIGDCIVTATDGELSVGCSTCVAATAVCGRDYCLNECISDTQSELCLACRCGQNADKHNCYDDYEVCSGTHLTDCDEIDAGTFVGYPHYDAGCPGEGGGNGG
jgi:hypothetical protein